MNAEEYVKTIINANALVKLKLEELRKLQYFAKGVSSFSSAESVEKSENIQERISSLEEVIRVEMEALLVLKEEAKTVVACVSDFEERTLLQLRYFGDLKWERIAMEMSCSLSTVFRLHKKALRNLNLILSDAENEIISTQTKVDNFDSLSCGSISI